MLCHDFNVRLVSTASILIKCRKTITWTCIKSGSVKDWTLSKNAARKKHVRPKSFPRRHKIFEVLRLRSSTKNASNKKYR